jgi:glycosyltransferase involved in cell wall biosynthesis
MRIAITHPTAFDRVRRGSERFMHELATFLAGRGHDVHVITCKPGRGATIALGSYTQHSRRRLWHPMLERVGVLEAHAFFGTTLGELLLHRYDVVQCLSFTDAYAAFLARRVTGVPYAFLVNGIPPQVPYFRSVTTRGAVFRASVQQADELIAVSGYISNYCSARFGRAGTLLPAAMNIDRFPLSTVRDQERPIILCTADLSDRRKGGRVLMRAFNLVKAECPTARLQVSCRALAQPLIDELLGMVAPSYRADVAFLGPGRVEDLPALYGRASVSVLPSLWEAFGLVVIEALATGTPGVGTRDGALPELLDDPTVGRLFDPGDIADAEPGNAAGLARALVDAMELSRRPETAENCRRHAARYDWSVIGPRYEALYQRLAARARGEG